MSELGKSFDSSADEYLRARSEYPTELIEHVVQVSQLGSNSRVLDVGCGSGQASIAFASRGYTVVAIDPAKRALDLLSERRGDFPNMELVHSTFEEFEAPRSSFDLVICAQAFHWLDPTTASRKVSELLRPTGHVMLFWHTQDVTPGTPQADLYALNSKHFDAYPRMNPPEYALDFLKAMEQNLCKHDEIYDPKISEFPWTQTYDRTMFVSLYHSWSKYTTLPNAAKKSVDSDLEEYLDSLTCEPMIKYRTCLIHARRSAT
jgi:SAM-dependent methyltransferase